jgi:diguanylate cyclase
MGANMTSPRTANASRSWSSVARWTLFGPLACVLVSVVWNAVMFADLGPEALGRAILSSMLLPLFIAGPLFLYLSLRMRQLSITNRRLGLVARTDSLTSCLNRGAFTARVQTLLEEERTCQGALLIIDADNFKVINDLYGHNAGDEALAILSRSLRAVIRPGDLIGRMGGEEFGVYLPNASEEKVIALAEQMRRAVQLAHFAPGGVHHTLTVSIGGAVFEGKSNFAELFRIADHRLYGAKHAGRNRALIVHTMDDPPVEMLRTA